MIGFQIPTVLDVLVSGCDFMVHYGHSCLIPVDRTQGIKMLYVFVDIKIDSLHFVETLKHNFDKGNSVILLRYFFFIQRGFYFLFLLSSYWFDKSKNRDWQPCQRVTVMKFLSGKEKCFSSCKCLSWGLNKCCVFIM